MPSGSNLAEKGTKSRRSGWDKTSKSNLKKKQIKQRKKFKQRHTTDQVKDDLMDKKRAVFPENQKKA